MVWQVAYIERLEESYISPLSMHSSRRTSLHYTQLRYTDLRVSFRMPRSNDSSMWVEAARTPRYSFLVVATEEVSFPFSPVTSWTGSLQKEAALGLTRFGPVEVLHVVFVLLGDHKRLEVHTGTLVVRCRLSGVKATSTSTRP